jgi:hypothetical protein
VTVITDNTCRIDAAADRLRRRLAISAASPLRKINAALSLLMELLRRSMMLKQYLGFALAALLVFGTTVSTAVSAPKGQRLTTDEVKIKVAKLGTGAKAKATVWLADGTKVKGYVSQAGDEDFIMRDRKSHTPTTVRYTDVVKFERNNGHSTAKWVGIGVAAGVGGFLIILFATLAHLD